MTDMQQIVYKCKEGKELIRASQLNYEDEEEEEDEEDEKNNNEVIQQGDDDDEEEGVPGDEFTTYTQYLIQDLANESTNLQNQDTGIHGFYLLQEMDTT